MRPLPPTLVSPHFSPHYSLSSSLSVSQTPSLLTVFADVVSQPEGLLPSIIRSSTLPHPCDHLRDHVVGDTFPDPWSDRPH